MDDSSELEQLRELIELYPASFPIDKVKEANRIARTRFDVLDDEIIPTIAQSVRYKKLDLLEYYFKLCEEFHSFIFKDIISINGKFRSKHHKGGGAVFFGGQKHQEMKAMFSGSSPHLIKREFSTAFHYLIQTNSKTPIDDAFRFYQKFVKTHPFYDGNGRVARLFVNLHLLINSKFLDWKNLHHKAKFLRKLNRFHKTGSEADFGYWINFCNKYVFEISDEDQM